jgi:outer membrane protein assembly factor BamB
MNGSAKPVRVAWFAVGCLLLGGAPDLAQSSVMAGNVTHASLAANPGTMISLKDPRTGMVFYVESSGRTLAALASDGRVRWIVDLSAATGREHVPAIRALRLDGDMLWATCGKSDAYSVQIDTGKDRYLGSDYTNIH